MPNGQVPTGAFAAGDPQAQEAVQAAIARRQQGGQPVAQLGQTGQQAPTVTPPVTAGTPQAVPQGMAAQPPLSPAQTEAQLIEKALAQRLSTISKVEVAQTVPEKPKQAPQVAPVGGGANHPQRSRNGQ